MIYVDHPELGSKLAQLVGYGAYKPHHDRSIVRYARGKLVGGALYTDYTGVAVTMHIASTQRRWLTPELLWLGFDYPFNQLLVNKIFGAVPSNNLPALRFAGKLGFFTEATLKDAVKTGDLLVLAMYKSSCRWLDAPQRIRRAAWDSLSRTRRLPQTIAG